MAQWWYASRTSARKGKWIMRKSRIAILALLLASPAVPAIGADLTKIDRTIPKEPAYRSQPEYCLLVLGPEAKERVWLVIDGDILYVDKNGSGDLTEEGDRIEAIRLPDYRLFRAGNIKRGNRDYLDLSVTRTRLADGVAELQPEHFNKLRQRGNQVFIHMVALRVENPLAAGPRPFGGDRITQSASSDSHGLLQFGHSPAHAPIVHFDGPWTMDLQKRPILLAGNVTDLWSGVGTKGLGVGTFGFITYEPIPKSVHPRVEIDFPPKTPGGEPVHVKYEIPARC
jgi:hypothetical protein